MALEAGSVTVILKGNFDAGAFQAFGAATNRAKTQMESAEKGISDSSGRITRSIGSIAKSAIGFSAAYAGIRTLEDALKGSVGSAVNFEKAMRNVNSIAGLSEKSYQSLSKSVLQLAGKTAQAPQTLAEGLYQIVSSGFKARDALTILKSSALGASAGLTDTETSTTAVVAALNAYHLKASDAAKVTDTLFQTVNRGVISFPQLAQNIGPVLAIAPQLGISLGEVGAAISTITKTVPDAANATTYLKDTMTAFIKPSKDLQAAIKQTGAANGESLIKTKGFQGALEAVAHTTDGTKTALGALFPDVRGLQGALVLLAQGGRTAADDLGYFTDKALKGATLKVFEEQSKSAALQIQQLKANLSVLGIEIGDKVLPALNGGVRGISQFVREMSNGTGAGGEFVDKLKEVGEQAEAAGRVLAKMGQDLGLDDIHKDTQAVEELAGAFVAFKAAEKAIAVVAAVRAAFAGLAAGIAAFSAAVESGGIGAALLGLLDPITTIPTLFALAGAAFFAFGGKLSDLKAPISFVLGLLSSLLGALGSAGHALGFLPGVGGAFKAMGSAAQDAQHAIDGVRDKLNGVPAKKTVKVDADTRDAISRLEQLKGTQVGNKVAKVLGNTDDAKTKLRELIALGIPDKNARAILQGSGPFLAGVTTLKGALAGLHDHTVYLNLVQRLQTQGATQFSPTLPGQSYTQLKHSTGTKTSGPELAVIGEGAGPEYVIPTEPKYRGRAIDLLMQAAGDLGIGGYAAGTKKGSPAARPYVKHPVPAKLNPISLPVDQIKTERDHYRQLLDADKEHVTRYSKQIDPLEKSLLDTQGRKVKGAAATAKKQRDLAAIRKKLQAAKTDLAKARKAETRDRRDYEEQDKRWRAAEKFQGEIDHDQALVERYRTLMDTANTNKDEKGYQSAKTSRTAALNALNTLLKKALAVVKDTAYKDTLEGEVATNDNELASDAAEQSPAEQAAADAAQAAADDLASTGLTPAEEQEQADINAQKALAALTPDLGDDTAAEQREVAFFQRVLGEAQSDPSRGGSATVAQFATSLKQAQDDLASLTNPGGGAQNSNADLQAELDQQKQRADTAEANLRNQTAEFGVLQNSGDLGYSSQPNITINTLHPGDPNTLRAIGDAAAGGQSLQAYRSSPRQNPGI